MIKDNSSRYTAMEGEKLMVDGNGCDTVRTQGVNFLTGWSSLKVVPHSYPWSSNMEALIGISWAKIGHSWDNLQEKLEVFVAGQKHRTKWWLPESS